MDLITSQSEPREVYGVKFPREEAASFGYKSTELGAAFDGLEGEGDGFVYVTGLRTGRPSISLCHEAFSYPHGLNERTFSYFRDVYPFGFGPSGKFFTEYELSWEKLPVNDERAVEIGRDSLRKPALSERIQANLRHYDVSFFIDHENNSKCIMIPDVSVVVTVTTPVDRIYHEFRRLQPPASRGARVNKEFRISDLSLDDSMKLFKKFVEGLR